MGFHRIEKSNVSIIIGLNPKLFIITDLNSVLYLKRILSCIFSMNLMRGMLRCCDLSQAAKSPSLVQRMHLENNIVRQFMERGEKLIQFYLPIAQILTDRMPLKPYADMNMVASTESIELPDIYPFDPLVMLWPRHIYNDQSNFPIKVISHG